MNKADSHTFFVRKNGYFQGWETVIYELGNNKDTYELQNFIHRWTFRESFVNSASSFSYWVLRDQDTLFSVADILYKSVYHFWIILMFNNLMDPFFSMPMKEWELQEFVKLKYGENRIHELHHYESGESGQIKALPSGKIVSADYPYTKVRITNYEFESRENHKRRYIKLMRPEYLDQVLREKNDIVNAKFIHKDRELTKIAVMA